MNQIFEILRIIVGSIYILFLPGLLLSYAFMKRGTVDLIERVALSFALSVSVVPLVAFYLNLLGVRISTLSIILEVLGILLATTIYLYVTNIVITKKDDKTL